MKLLFVPQHFTVPRDHGVLTGEERGEAANAVAMKTAVSRKDVSGKEKDVRLWRVFMITLPTKYYVCPGKQVDDEVLSAEKGDKLPNNQQQLQ